MMIRFNKKVLFFFQKMRIIFYGLKISKVEIIGRPIKKQPLMISGKGRLIFKERVTIGFFPSPFFFSGYAYFDFRGDAEIFIGENVMFNNNATLVSDGAKIEIFNDCLIGPNFSVYTSDFHGIHPKERNTGNYERKGVTISENVFIGANVTILKGVTIGENSVIATGSVVSNSIPANVIAGGVPCKVLREITE